MASIPIAYAMGNLHMPRIYLVAFVVGGTFDVFFNVCSATMFVSVTGSAERYVEEPTSAAERGFASWPLTICSVRVRPAC